MVNYGKYLAIKSYELVKTTPASMQFRAEIERGSITKTITIADNRIDAQYTAGQFKGEVMSVRLLLAMPCCDGYAGRYLDAHNKILGGFGEILTMNKADRLILDDGVLGGHLILGASQSVSIYTAPYFTVSQSEAGFEKIMQAVEITVQFQIGDGALSLWLESKQGNIEL
ncbi:MAG: hypothetical protein A2Y51_01715 [Gallionellales bacterium RIFCSPLOWO2_02_60_31]|nr:MAG: hypothetical protein A2Y51_01715 [Gallionellales bacterium RIFCSPLOWO2_02_60_31]